MAYESDEQQAEALKKWWRENGKQVVFGGILGLAVVFGWRGWQDYQAGINAEAAQLYTEMSLAVRGGKNDVAAKHGQLIFDEYGTTVYADFAAMTLAKIAVNKGDGAAAAKHLQRVVDKSSDPAMVDLARLRLARVLLSDGKTADAKALLGQVSTAAFGGESNEIAGDIAVVEGDKTAARNAYQKAMRDAFSDKERLGLKLDDLAEPVGVK